MTERETEAYRLRYTEGMTYREIANAMGVDAVGVAAGLWLWASMIAVPDNIDTIVSELQRIGRLNASAAGAACIAAVCGVILFAIQLIQR